MWKSKMRICSMKEYYYIIIGGNITHVKKSDNACVPCQHMHVCSNCKVIKFTSFLYLHE